MPHTLDELIRYRGAPVERRPLVIERPGGSDGVGRVAPEAVQDAFIHWRCGCAAQLGFGSYDLTTECGVDHEFETAKKNMREQVDECLRARYPGVRVNRDAPAVDNSGAYALHFEVWANSLWHVRISDSACVVMRDVVNIADELERIGLGDALDVPPHDVAILASDIGPGLRLQASGSA